MAIYMATFKNISRASGRSVVAAAAYRSCSCLKSEYDGVESDYTKKDGLVYEEIILPDNAPEEYKDRSRLWNAVELAEPYSDCRLARECLLALPVELSLEQQIELVRRFVRENFTDNNMVADLTIHSPVLKDDLKRPIDENGDMTLNPDRFIHNNPHAHILLTVRPIGKDGKWEAKTQKEYLCRRGDEEKGFSGEEFKTAKADGWEKQYRYIDSDGKKVWLTPSEAEEKGLDGSRISRSPRSSTHGRENPTTAFWNSPDRIKEWRKAWEDCVNDKFKELGMDIRIDSRSYKDQGIDRVPQMHMGPYVNNEEKKYRRLAKKGKEIERTEIGERNQLTREYNKNAEECEMITEELSRRMKKAAERCTHLRKSYMSNVINGEILRRSMEALEPDKKEEASINEFLNMLNSLQAIIEKAEKAISELSIKLAGLGKGQKKEKETIQKQIDSNKKDIADNKAIAESKLQQSKFHDAETLREATEQMEEQKRELRKTEQRLAESEKENKAYMEECKEIMDSIPKVCMGEFEDNMEKMSPNIEEEMREEYKSLVGDGFSEAEFQRYIQKTDDMLTRKKNNPYGKQEKKQIQTQKRKGKSR